MKLLIFTAFGALILAVPAQADVRSYCEAYARNQADVRLSGSAILGAKSELSSGAWEERKTLALADCLTLYTAETPKPVVEAVKAKPKPRTVRAKRRAPTLLARRTAPAQQERSTGDASGLIPGSRAWEDYCAAKYVSFNRATNTYKSYNGKQRPCRAPKS